MKRARFFFVLSTLFVFTIGLWGQAPSEQEGLLTHEGALVDNAMQLKSVPALILKIQSLDYFSDLANHLNDSAQPMQLSAQTEVLSAPLRVWLNPDGKPLPFRSDAEVLAFLRTAKILSTKKLTSGITKPLKVLLEKDGLQMHAIFHDVDISQQVAKFKDGRIERRFRDDYHFQEAAYKLSQLLGLDNVPPTILRQVKGKPGSLQAWVENAMSQRHRIVKKIAPPNMTLWNQQMSLLLLFDQLIANTDRHNSNILIDPNWRIWLIDHTRAFRPNTNLAHPNLVQTCERTLWNNLQALDRKTADTVLKKSLLGSEIKAVFKRRDEIVRHLKKLIEEKGESQVLFTLKPPAPAANPFS